MIGSEFKLRAAIGAASESGRDGFGICIVPDEAAPEKKVIKFVLPGESGEFTIDAANARALADKLMDFAFTIDPEGTRLDLAKMLMEKSERRE